MVNVGFSNYEQFVKYFTNASDKVRRILFKAYPEYAAKLASQYMGSIKKIEQSPKKVKTDRVEPKQIEYKSNKLTTNKVEPNKVGTSKVQPKAISAEQYKAITQNPINQSKPNPNLNDAFDTLYGKTKDVANKAKGIKIPSIKMPNIKVPNILKGAGRLTTAIAPAQGLVDMNTNKPGTLENARGATMFGSGALGLATANPYLLTLAGGLALGSAIAEPAGNAIGDLIYKPKDIVYNPDFTLLDTTQNLKGQPYTPEELQKVLAFNDAQNAKIAQQYGQAMVPYGATSEPTQAEQSGSIPSNYSQSVPQGTTPIDMGITPQSLQNVQEGGLNNYQDILQVNPIQPTLNPIVEPVNYSNLYQQRANQLINELGGEQPQIGEQQMTDINPYNQIRGYDINGLRDDVIPGYLQVMQGIAGGKTGLDYQKILEQYKSAMDADARQNQVNQMVNTFGTLGERSTKAPVYYVGANGDLRRIELDQPNTMAPLPTNITSNTDKFTGQLAIQQAQQEQAAAQYKQYQDLLKAQQERIDMENQANALAQRFGGDPAMYMNKDVINTLLKETINPNIQARANIAETIGKAPTQARLKQAEQLQEGANKLDEVTLNQQYNAMIANINANAKANEQAMIQSGLDRRTAATLASQAAISQYVQMMENLRAMNQLQNAKEIQGMKGQSAKDVANIYRAGSSKSNEYDIRVAQDKDWNTLIGIGTPIPEAIQYMQAKYPGWGSTEAELRELNR